MTSTSLRGLEAVAEQVLQGAEIVNPRFAAGLGHKDQSLRAFALIAFVLTDKSGCFQLGQMGGQITVCGLGLGDELCELCRADRGQIGHHGQANPAVNNVVYLSIFDIIRHAAHPATAEDWA